MPEKDFWAMSLREFDRYIKGAENRLKEARLMRYQVAALQTAEMINIIGAVNSKKGQWNQILPSQFLDSWLGNTSSTDERLARIKRANKAHDERMAREKARRAS